MIQAYSPWRAFVALLVKECFLMVTNPFLYVLMALFSMFYFLLIFVFFFLSGIVELANLSEIFLLVILFFNLLLPVPVLAREQRQGTLEFLLSTPMSEGAIILAKYTALLLYYSILVVITLPAYVYLQMLVVLPVPELLLQYGIMFLFGASVLALGLWFSALATREAPAAMLGVSFALFAIFLNGSLSFVPQPFRDVLAYFILLPGTKTFIQGVLSLEAVAYYLIYTACFIVLAISALKAKRWTNRIV